MDPAESYSFRNAEQANEFFGRIYGAVPNRAEISHHDSPFHSPENNEDELTSRDIIYEDGEDYFPEPTIVSDLKEGVARSRRTEEAFRNNFEISRENGIYMARHVNGRNCVVKLGDVKEAGETLERFFSNPSPKLLNILGLSTHH